MKKKIFFISLIVFSCLFINVNALGDGDSSSATVKVGDVDATVYKMETTWGKMEFTYIEQINYLWDSDSHTYYVGESTYKWVNEDNYIDVVNKSYLPVEVELVYTSLNENIEGTFDVSKVKLLNDEKNRFVLTLNGKLDNNVGYQKVGLINIRLS